MVITRSVDTIVPVKPAPLFDLGRLRTSEFAPFIYKSKLGFDDMLATGYLHAAAPLLTGVDSEILVDENLGERRVGNFTQTDRRVVVRVTITLAYRTSSSGIATREMRFQGLAEGTSMEPSKAVKDALIRVVETRALKRAIGRALNISSQAINGKVFVPEEEDGVPPEMAIDTPTVPAAAPGARSRPMTLPTGVADDADATDTGDDW